MYNYNSRNFLNVFRFYKILSRFKFIWHSTLTFGVMLNANINIQYFHVFHDVYKLLHIEFPLTNFANIYLRDAWRMEVRSSKIEQSISKGQKLSGYKYRPKEYRLPTF